MENFETRFISVLRNYMSSENINYAYLLSGQWGIGKTYFCTKTLPEQLGKSRKVIDISLYGKKTVDDINKDLMLKLIGIQSNATKVSEIIRKTSNEVDNTQIKLAFAAFGFLSRYAINGIIKNIKHINIKKDVLIVFDDLERCDSTVLSEFLGYINSTFIETGHHVLFVAYEEELIKNYEEFSNKKEKLIRTTFYYEANIKETAACIVSKRENSSPSKKLFEDKQKLSCLPEAIFKIMNLRTWLFAFDLFDNAVFAAKMQNNPYITNLFLIIILDIYYMNNNPQLFNVDPVEYLTNDNVETVSKAIRKNFNILADEGSFSFYGREWRLRNRNGFTPYTRMLSVEEFIKTRFFDVQKFIEEFDETYPVGTKYENAYVDMYKVHSMDETLLGETCSVIIEGIHENKYSIRKLINLDATFENLENDGYLALLSYPFSFRADIALSLKSKDSDEIMDFLNSFEDPITSSYDFASFCKQQPSYISEILIKWHEEFHINNNKKNFETVFSHLEEYHFNNIPSFAKEEMAKQIAEYDLINLFFSFNCTAIERFTQYVDSISYCSNCGEISSYYSEITPLTKIKTVIEAKLTTTKKSKEKIELQYLCKKIQEACLKLEETHGTK